MNTDTIIQLNRRATTSRRQSATQRRSGAQPGNWAGGAHLVLLPTDGCNLRCVYCYQGHQPVTMSREVQTGVRRLMERLVEEQHVPWLHLEWYGGEPLAAWAVVDELATHGKQLADAHGIGFSMSMTTNATLLSAERFERLTELSCTDYQITVDGPPEDHDLRRVSAAGRGSFDRVWSALIRMQESSASFRVVVRLGFDRSNMEAMLQWVPGLAEVFGGDKRFQFYGRPISYPNDNGLGCSAEEAGRFSAELAVALEAAGLATVDMAREGRPGGLGCHAGRANSVMIGASGILHKCSVSLEAGTNNVGRVREDGTLELDMDLWNRWVTAEVPCRIVAGEQQAAACPKSPELACPKAPQLACPKAPEAACPKAPELACPKAPEAACPKAPQLACPKAPELACPKAPELACPKAPREMDLSAFACPKAPQLACPKSPELACPKAPELACPKAPEVACPKAPRGMDLSAFACPKAPQLACPKGPQLSCPKAPELACPKAPQLACPKAPELACPKAPELACPKAPREMDLSAFACPKAPQLACPKAPEVACPKAPQLACPKSPELACPKAPELACPKAPELACPKAPRGMDLSAFACPKAPQLACPKAPELACPKAPQLA
ncbi:MAG: radical SAM protein, partial [Acidobacteria bacterium]|nr:radical SAM protein [Acidobacteriota bacterium]